ncbi:MAG: FecR domain-containing protein [Candidatus Riflebacteria bacterium]|nr:FecR domain-containing protein [Candidatus Riflebacteria bacterium]
MALRSGPITCLAWLLVGCLLGPCPLLADSPSPPTLVVTGGNAETKADQAGWTKALTGQTVPFGTVIKTGQGFEGHVSYTDGTTLTIKPFSMLQVLSDGLRLHRGQAWIKVVKRGKGFTCVTPSAIASVRGTSFSCQVPPIGRLFGRRYASEFFGSSHLKQGLRGHLITASIGLALLSGLVAEAPGGRVPVTVKVFEGRVFVVYPGSSGGIKQTWFLDQGEKVCTDRGEASIKIALVKEDYERWDQPVPSTAAPEQPSVTATSMEEPPARRPTEDATRNPLRLMQELYDTRE